MAREKQNASPEPADDNALVKLLFGGELPESLPVSRDEMLDEMAARDAASPPVDEMRQYVMRFYDKLSEIVASASRAFAEILERGDASQIAAAFGKLKEWQKHQQVCNEIIHSDEFAKRVSDKWTRLIREQTERLKKGQPSTSSPTRGESFVDQFVADDRLASDVAFTIEMAALARRQDRKKGGRPKKNAEVLAFILRCREANPSIDNDELVRRVNGEFKGRRNPNDRSPRTGESRKYKTFKSKDVVRIEADHWRAVAKATESPKQEFGNCHGNP